jgi:hypothetical protein
MRVVVELSEAGASMLKSGWREIRGNAPDPTGQHWSVRLAIDESTEGGLTIGDAKFLTREAERQFSERVFEVRAGIILMARCTPLHGHD